MVPPAGTPKRSSAIAQAVLAHPPIYAARAPSIAPAGPCARREPNSLTGRPFAARTMPVSYTHLPDESSLDAVLDAQKRGKIGSAFIEIVISSNDNAKSLTIAAVSYTHLDVYKRQP